MENQEVTKRPYTKPEIEVIDLDQTPQLLAQSPDPMKFHYGEMD